MFWLYWSINRGAYPLIAGNIIAALFYAFVPMLVLLDIPPIYRIYGKELITMGVDFNFSIYWLLSVALFVFLIALAREILKDTEQFESDVNYDRPSLPFIMGAHFAKWTVNGINAANIIILALYYCFFLRHIAGWLSLFYIMLIIISLLFICYKIYHATTGDDYRHAKNAMSYLLIAAMVLSIMNYE